MERQATAKALVKRCACVSFMNASMRSSTEAFVNLIERDQAECFRWADALAIRAGSVMALLKVCCDVLQEICCHPRRVWSTPMSDVILQSFVDHRVARESGGGPVGLDAVVATEACDIFSPFSQEQHTQDSG